MLGNLSNFISILCAGGNAEAAVDPLYEAITLIGPYAIGVVVTLGLVYGVIIGVKFAKEEDPKNRATLQKALINGVIGFLAVITLVVILYAIRGPLTEWMNS